MDKKKCRFFFFYFTKTDNYIALYNHLSDNRTYQQNETGRQEIEKSR